jgi:hypothetical protein
MPAPSYDEVQADAAAKPGWREGTGHEALMQHETRLERPPPRALLSFGNVKLRYAAIVKSSNQLPQSSAIKSSQSSAIAIIIAAINQHNYHPSQSSPIAVITHRNHQLSKSLPIAIIGYRNHQESKSLAIEIISYRNHQPAQVTHRNHHPSQSSLIAIITYRHHHSVQSSIITHSNH